MSLKNKNKLYEYEIDAFESYIMVKLEEMPIEVSRRVLTNLIADEFRMMNNQAEAASIIRDHFSYNMKREK
jgi:hypothetical protein